MVLIEQIFKIILTHTIVFTNMGPDIKDTIANGTSIAALGGVLMDWQAPLTILLVLTGIILNTTRIYDWYKQRGK